MIPILDNSERARRVVLFFWVFLGVNVLSICSNLFLNIVLQDDSLTNEDLITQAAYVQYSLVALLEVGLNLAVVITFIQWFRRAYHNLERAGIYINEGEGWAAGAWFVPIMSLYKPYRIAKEIWYETQAAYSTEVESHGSLKTWWTFFLIKTIFDNVTSRLSWRSSSVDDHIRDTWLGIIGGVLTIVAILVTVRVIRQIASFEKLFQQHLQIQTVGEKAAVVEDDTEDEQY